MINKRKVMERLKMHLDYVIKSGFDKDNILGIFLYGSQNYGFANENSDVDSRVILLPTFDDICFKKEWTSIQLELDKEHIEIKDIRTMRQMYMKQNINFIETLFTEYQIINPKYKDLFERYFIANREIIAHYDIAKTVISCSQQLAHTLKQNPEDNKKLHNAARINYFLERYIAGDPYEKCLKPEGDIFFKLWNLKYGAFPLSREEKREMALDILVEVNDRQLRCAEAASPSRDAAQKAMDTGVQELMKASLNFVEDTKKEQMSSKEDFFKDLTNAEHRAYLSVVREIGDEGAVSISKLIEKNTISRSVYTNLFVKMKNNNVAIINNMGVKGTHIKIIEPQLKSEAIDFK